MPPQSSFKCTCGYPLCVCGVPTPMKPPATGWLPPTPASPAKKPAVFMWIPADTTASPPLTPRTPPREGSAKPACLLPLPAAMRPAVAMPGSTAAISSAPGPSLSSTDTTTMATPVVSKSRATTTATSPSPPQGTINLAGALEMLADLGTALEEKDKTLDMISLDMMALYKQHQEDMVAMHSKFRAMHFHCVNLSREVQKKNVKLDLLRESDRLQKHLSQQQQLLARSTVALYKQHKTRFIMGQHSVAYRPTGNSPAVQQEMYLAASRIRRVKQEQERDDHNKLSAAVDQLARKYDRYNLISSSNIHNTRCASDGLPCIVPRDLMGIWLFADMQEPSVEEKAMYEFHLQQEVRGPPIYSPTLPRPTVNWTNLNKHRRKNLPDPELFPISSAPEDPSYYTNMDMYKPADMHNRLWTPKECGCVECLPHFGHRYGLMTDMGVIAMPDSAVHGYRWDDFTGGWVIATGC